MGSLWRDIRFSLRMLAKNRSFTAFAVLTLALGIGVNTAMFSLAADLLLRPLPVSRPSELVAIATASSAVNPGLSWKMYLEYRGISSVSFTGLAGYSEKTPMTISRADGSKISANAAVITGNYFDVLGVRPFRGRLIGAEDDGGTSDGNVAVLSHRAWGELFGGRADAVGATLRLGGFSYTVIGVTPPDFTGISLDSTPDVWIPMESQIHGNTVVGMMAKSIDSTFFRSVGRLKHGLSISQARQQFDAEAIQLGAGKSVNVGWKIVEGHSVPDQWVKPRPTLAALEDTRGGSSRASTLILFGAIALLFLLVVCDIASMLLARFERRRRGGYPSRTRSIKSSGGPANCGRRFASVDVRRSGGLVRRVLVDQVLTLASARSNAVAHLALDVVPRRPRSRIYDSGHRSYRDFLESRTGYSRRSLERPFRDE